MRDGARREPGRHYCVSPLIAGIVADVGGIAQQLDRLQITIQQGGAQKTMGSRGRNGVHEDSGAAGFEDTPGFTQGTGKIMPVVGAVTAEDEIESGILEGQVFNHALTHRYIAKAAIAADARGGIEHFARQIIGDHLANMRRRMKGHMTAAASKIEDARIQMTSNDRGHTIEIRACRMDPARDISRGLWAKARGNKVHMRCIQVRRLQG